MNIRVFPSSFKGSVDVIGSKSLSHRYLIAAALSPYESQLYGLMDSDDIRATKNILSTLGATIDLPSVKGPLKITSNTTLDAAASGSTLRFMIPQLLRFAHSFILSGKDRLPKRSLKAYQDAFSNQPITFKPLGEDWLPLELKGPLKPGTYEIDGDISSQFISGLCMALPFLEGDSIVHLNTPVSSAPYLTMTLWVLAEFGIQITQEERRLIIPGQQSVSALKKTIEGDYSQALFFIAGALLGGELTLLNLPKNSLQGDAFILELLSLMGVTFDHQDHELKIKSQSFKSVDLSLDATPDMAPMLMLLSAFGNGPSTFRDLSRLREKESDRYQVILDTLTNMGVITKGSEQALSVQPIKSFTAKQPFQTHHDHRIAMACLMLAPKAAQPYIIEGVECIDKSYPDFLEIYQSIGGRYEIIGGTA